MTDKDLAYLLLVMVTAGALSVVVGMVLMCVAAWLKERRK